MAPASALGNAARRAAVLERDAKKRMPVFRENPAFSTSPEPDAIRSNRIRL